MSIIFNSADIAETMNNGVSNVTGADSTITENYTNVVQHGIKIDMSVSEKTISGVPPLSFNSNGTPLIDYTIYGNSVQDGTPTPESPVSVNGVGTLSSGNYVIPVSTNAVTNINLNSVSTTRRIKKATVTLSNLITLTGGNKAGVFVFSNVSDYAVQELGLCNVSMYDVARRTPGMFYVNRQNAIFIGDTNDTLETLKAKYDDCTLWYVLETPKTEVTNEPLMKIGDYADSVSYSQSGVTIPTASGNNTLDVQTTPKPSNVSITYKGR